MPFRRGFLLVSGARPEQHEYLSDVLHRLCAGRVANRRRECAARERAGFIEGRIAELESKLGNAQIIDPKLLQDSGGRCVFGATVDVEDGDGNAATWQIVGEDEADIKQGRISVSSPIARALIGQEAGESVEVKPPGGIKSYEIIDVRYE